MVEKIQSSATSFSTLAKEKKFTPVSGGSSKVPQFTDLAKSNKKEENLSSQLSGAMSSNPQFLDIARSNRKSKTKVSTPAPTPQNITPSPQFTDLAKSNKKVESVKIFSPNINQPTSNRRQIEKIESIKTFGAGRISASDKKPSFIKSFGSSFRQGFFVDAKEDKTGRSFGDQLRTGDFATSSGLLFGGLTNVALINPATKVGSKVLPIVKGTEQAIISTVPKGFKTITGAGIIGGESLLLREGIEKTSTSISDLTKEQKNFLKSQSTQELYGETILRQSNNLTGGQAILFDLSQSTRPEGEFVNALKQTAKDKGISLSTSDIDAIKQLRKSKSRAELGSFVNIARFGEVMGGQKISEKIAKTSPKTFAQTFKTTFPALFSTGLVEGGVSVLTQQNVREQQRVRPFLPDGSFSEIVQGQADIGRGAEIAVGSLGGGLTAGTIGGFIGAAPTSTRRSTRASGKVVNVLANIFDPFEKPGDVLADVKSSKLSLFGNDFVSQFPLSKTTSKSGLSTFSTGSVRSDVQIPFLEITGSGNKRVGSKKGTSFTNDNQKIFSQNYLFTDALAFSPAPSITPTVPTKNVPIKTNVQNLINNNIINPVPSKPKNTIPINEFITLNTNIKTEGRTQSQTQVPTQTIIPTLTNVNTVTPVFKIPPPLPFAFGFGRGRTGAKSKQKIQFSNELSTGLQLLSGGLGFSRSLSPKKRGRR